MVMRALTLNFIRTPRSRPWLGMVLLIMWGMSTVDPQGQCEAAHQVKGVFELARLLKLHRAIKSLFGFGRIASRALREQCQSSEETN